MKTKQILQEAHSLIEKGWTQKVFALDTNGKEIDPMSPGARCWCASGAVWKVVGNDAAEAYTSACSILDNLVCSNFNNVTEFNDCPETTQSDVLHIFEKAIERCDNDS